MNKKKEEVKEFRIRFCFDEEGKVSFYDPNFDKAPVGLFPCIMKKIGEAESDWNNKMSNRNDVRRSNKEC